MAGSMVRVPGDALKTYCVSEAGSRLRSERVLRSAKGQAFGFSAKRLELEKRHVKRLCVAPEGMVDHFRQSEGLRKEIASLAHPGNRVQDMS